MDSLKSLGLTGNESRIFRFLISNGSSRTGKIISSTRIVNSQVYRALENLISKGLVNYSNQQGGKVFQACDPNTLFEQAEDEFLKKKKLIKELKKLNAKEQSAKSAVYEGFNGFKTAFRQIIDETPIGGTINIIGFSTDQPALSSLRVFLKNQNLKSRLKKQKLRIILSEKSLTTLGKDRKNEPYTKVRYLPDEYIGPAAVDITEDAVYTFLWDEEPFVHIIHNKRIAESYKKYFERMWKEAKE